MNDISGKSCPPCTQPLPETEMKFDYGDMQEESRHYSLVWLLYRAIALNVLMPPGVWALARPPFSEARVIFLVRASLGMIKAACLHWPSRYSY
jgi:hypothetical protein